MAWGNDDADLFAVHKLNQDGLHRAAELGEAFNALLAVVKTHCPEGRERDRTALLGDRHRSPLHVASPGNHQLTDR